MHYLYYPGCSLEGTAREYHASTLAFMYAMGHELVELEDWTCCGAGAAEGISTLLALALPARNLALAERQGRAADLLVPCSACYLNLKRVTVKIGEQEVLRENLNAIMEDENLRLKGTLKVRHLLDVLSRDIGPQLLAEKVLRPLKGLTVAPYYGCQCLRPYPEFDDPEQPASMEGLIRAAGARPMAWSMGAKCCGASHINTKPELGQELTGAILIAARGADAILTVCPMCQMNLEAYQKRISRIRGQDLAISVLYLPQFLGLAIGLPENRLQLDLNLAVLPAFKAKLARCSTRMRAAAPARG
jgi:heterodisulfide reductase subunit B2